jgi:hypothetical protein
MSNSIYLDPSYGNPPTIVIDGICYVSAAPTSTPPDTSSAGSGAGCCPQSSVPCPCPGGLSSSYTILAPDGTTTVVTASLPDPCLWTNGGGQPIIQIYNLSAIGETGCVWSIGPPLAITKNFGLSPAGSYTDLYTGQTWTVY